MQSRCLALHKPHDILGGQAREHDRPAAEAIVEEPADKRHIIDDRCPRQSALLAQVPLKCLDAAVNRAELGWTDLLGGNHAPMTQKIQELCQHRGIFPAKPPPPCPRLEIGDRMRR
jgi:hypothetical protein